MGNINDLGFPFTSIGGDRQYSALEWREYFSKLIKNGVIQNDGGGVQVKPQAAPNKTVFVDTGTVFIDGAMRVIESVTNLTCADNASGNPRIDRIVARLNYTDRKIEFVVKQGTPAASPTAPALTRNTTVYELALADITLDNGYTTITAGVITDQISDVSLCGASSMTIGVIPPSGLDAVTVQLESETQALYGVENVDDAIKKAVSGHSSYHAFCANVNVTSVECAFGKNNEDELIGLGKQLAMYAWFKGTDKTNHPFTNLINKSTFMDSINNQNALNELIEDSNIMNLVLSSSYAMSKLLANLSGLSVDEFTDVSQLTSNSSAMIEISKNALALNLAIKSSIMKQSLITNQVVFNTVKSNMVNTMSNAPTLFTKTTVNGGFPYSMVTETIIVGSQTSFIEVVSLVDASSSNGSNFTNAKHNYDQTEIIHTAFPTGTGTGTVSPNVFAVGGLKLIASGSINTLTYNTYKYEAL